MLTCVAQARFSHLSEQHLMHELLVSETDKIMLSMRLYHPEITQV